MTGLYGTDLPTLPMGFLVWLATGSLHAAIFGMRWLYGLARFLHLIGAGGFFGIILITETRRLGWHKGAAGPDIPRLLLLRVLHGSFALTLVSGLALVVYDPIGIGLHSMFLPKLLLVLLGLAHAHGRLGAPGASRRFLPRQVSAGLALALWISVMGAATWNHVERPAKINAVLRANAIGHD